MSAQIGLLDATSKGHGQLWFIEESEGGINSTSDVPDRPCQWMISERERGMLEGDWTSF